MTAAQPSCPACASPETRSYLKGSADHTRAVEKSFELFICARCHLRFQSIDSREASRLYDIEDVASVKEAPTRRALRADDDVLAALARQVRGRRLLEVGAGDGAFLTAAKKAGFEAIGTDVSERLAKAAAERTGCQVLVGQLADFKLPAASFDVINVEQVLMYIPEPRPFLAEVRRLLAPGGVARIREYDADSLSARRAGRHYWMYSPIHVNVWTQTALDAAAHAAGLELFQVHRGTEASLWSWLRAERNPGLKVMLRATAQFAARHVALGKYCVGADNAYYLRPAG